MDLSRKKLLARMSACQSDLADNGICTDAMGPRALRDLALRNMEYFQAMLGCDAGVPEVVELMTATSQSPRARPAVVAWRAPSR